MSEVLYFISNNFDKLTSSQLKPVLINFYNDEELDVAKDILLKAVKKTCEGTMTCHAYQSVKDQTNVNRMLMIYLYYMPSSMNVNCTRNFQYMLLHNPTTNPNPNPTIDEAGKRKGTELGTLIYA